MITSTEAALRDKLRKIESLFSGSDHPGEKDAANAARKRIIDKLKAFKKVEKAIEVRAPIHDRWSRQLFIALCRRYDIKPYRYARQRETSVMIKAPKSFIDNILWPEYQALNGALVEYLSQVTDKLIHQAIHSNTSQAEEINSVTSL